MRIVPPPPLIASLVLALAPVGAAAVEETEYVVEPADVYTGDPGNLVIDASKEGRVAIALPEEPLKFATMDEFVGFMVDKHNAEPSLDKDGNPDWYTLHQTVIGTPFYFDGADWLEAEDPVALMVGGLSGQVEIGGRLVCVNLAICGLGQAGLLASMAPSLAQPMASATTYNRACSEYHCGETTVLGWDPAPTAGFQKIKVKTWDLRYGRARFTVCGYWPGYPRMPKYCATFDKFPNELSQTTIFFRLNECKWDASHLPIRMVTELGRNVSSIWEIYDRGNWYSATQPPVASGYTYHDWRYLADPGNQAKVSTFFNQFNRYDYECTNW